MPEILTPEDVQRRLSTPAHAIELHRQAIEGGMTLSAYLETINPSERGDPLDAFDRQLMLAGIVTRSDPAAGYWASMGDTFYASPLGRALYPEYFARQWRKVAFGTTRHANMRGMYGRDNKPVMLSSEIAPELLNAASGAIMWDDEVSPAIPLSEIVARTRPLDGSDFRSLWLDYDAEGVRQFRVGEAAEIPMGWLRFKTRAIAAHKYARGLRVSYELLRRLPIDTVGWWIRFLALQAEIDKVLAGLEVIVNGDGNPDTGAEVLDLTDLDTAATPGTLTLPAWIAFRMSFQQPYALTTVLGDFDSIMQLVMLNIGTANVPVAGMSFAGIGNSLVPINSVPNGVRYGWLEEIPPDTLLGFDSRFGLEQVMEIGSEIQETERFITNQTEVVTMSENSGFGVIGTGAAKILNLAA